MVIVNIFLLFFSGFLATKYFLKEADFLGKIGLSIFLSLAVIPFININSVLLGNKYLSFCLTLINSIIIIVFFILLLSFQKNNEKKIILAIPTKKELLILLFTILIGIFFFYYYTNEEFILSLGSYLIKGDAPCFYMQTFQALNEFISDIKSISPVNNAYEIICTPGNILFTATAISVFKLYGFKILYLLFMSLLFIFVYLISAKITRNTKLAFLTALFSLFNPYILSVEVLDRNVIALSISVILFYLIIQYRKKVFFHGLIFGVMAGTGLRFLPLLFVFPILIIYYQQRINFKEYLVFIAGFIITFTFNIPHLYFHGFHSLGETSTSFNLIIDEFTKWRRTPFLPFPNLIFYLLNILNYFGWLVSAIILAGIFKLWNENKRFFLAFLVMFLSVLFVLSYQRNWLESDKCRIIISVFLPLYIFFAFGLKYIFSKEYAIKKIVIIFACFLLPIILVRLISVFNFSMDEEFYQRKFLYQSESSGYHDLTEKFLLDISILPNYKRLFTKLDLKRKACEEKIVFDRLFPKDGLPGFIKFKNFYSEWKQFFLKDVRRSQRDSVSGYSYLKIDFCKLVNNLSGSVEKINYSDMPSIDLKTKDALFDVYYTDLKVDWQTEILPVCLILRREEIEYLKELNIDLNAFVSFGKDDTGFDTIYPVNFKVKPFLNEYGHKGGMGSFPLISENNTLVLYVPDDLKIVIRNWFINDNGSSYKIDSWCIKQDNKGNYGIKFFYNEPESYL